MWTPPRRWLGAAILLSALLSAGCQDPSLHVVVERAAAYARQIDRVEVTVYQRDDLRCDDLAFDKLTAEELRSLERARGSGSFEAVPRLGRKAVVARGYGKSLKDPSVERLLIAGCTELDDLTEQQERVVVTTEPVASVAIDASFAIAGKGALEIAVVAVDGNQNGIDGKEVRWTTYGAAGTFPTTGDVNEPTTGQLLTQGEGTIRPTPPTKVGPFVVQVRVKWSTGLPPPTSSMMITAPSVRALGLNDTPFINTCTIYTNNNLPTLACLEKDTATTRFVRSYRLQSDLLIPAAAPVPVPNAIGIFGVGAGVVVVNADGTYVGVLGARYTGTVCLLGCGAATVVDVLGFVGCTGTTPALFAHYREGLLPRLVATSLTTGDKRPFVPPTDTAPTPSLLLGAVGCVTDLEAAGGVQAAATVSTSTSSAIYALGNANALERRRDRRQSGTGFTVSGKEARLLTTEVDATGFVVVESVLSKPVATYRLFERRRSAAVAPPRHYVSGAFDLDAETDLAWDVLDDADTLARSIQVLLAARPGRPVLSGRIPMLDTGDLLAADLDGDGVSEVIGYSNNSVTVQRLGGPVQ